MIEIKLTQEQRGIVEKEYPRLIRRKRVMRPGTENLLHGIKTIIEQHNPNRDIFNANEDIKASYEKGVVTVVNNGHASEAEIIRCTEIFINEISKK